MNLPKNGRIIVIDDKYEEAQPLLTALYKNQHAALYFSGDRSGLPDSPLSNAWVVFLDMQLTEGYTDDKSKASTTAGIFNAIIDIKVKRKYLVVFWARHTDLIDLFRDYINTTPDKQCDFIEVHLDKEDCKNHNYDINYISSQITNMLGDQHAFRFLIEWENIVHKSSDDLVGDFSRFGFSDEEWNNKMLGIYKSLAQAQAGKQLQNNPDQITQNALLALGGTFRDSLESNIHSMSSSSLDYTNASPVSDPNVEGKINSKLLLMPPSSTPRPGNIYEVLDDSLRDSISKDIFNSDLSLGTQNEIKLLMCEFSPNCDYAQNKWRVHRLVYGVLIPQELDRSPKKAEYLFMTPWLEINDAIVKMVFDMRQLHTIKLSEITNSCIASMRKELLTDLQHKIAGHSSRPGIINL